ncbi:MAG: outer membrane beta-barrel protein [Aquabacterium commune]
MAAALLMSVSASAQAQVLQPATAPLGVYVGGTAGFGINNWQCDATCDRAAFSGKIFAGKRLTPGLAAEVNYFMFGKTNRSNANPAAQAMGYSIEERKVTAWTLGINWEVELIQDFTNQIRVGWGALEQKNTRLLTNNTSVTSKNHFTAPYIGAGLAFRLTRDIKLVSTVDAFFKGHNSQYLLSVGGMAEF